MKSENRRRTEITGVRMLPIEKEILDRASTEDGVKLPEFLRSAGLAKAEGISPQHKVGTVAVEAVQATIDILAKHNPLHDEDEQTWYCFDGTFGHAQFESIEEWRAHVATYLVAAIKNL